MNCEHHNFMTTVNVARIEDKQPMRFYADIKINCTDCGEISHFVGVKDFGLSPDHPCANPDSTELRCPIAPGRAEFIPSKLTFKVS